MTVWLVAGLGCLMRTGGMGGMGGGMGMLSGRRMEWGVGTGLLAEGGRPGRDLAAGTAAHSRLVAGFGILRGTGRLEEG